MNLEKETGYLLQVIYKQRLVIHSVNLIHHLFPLEWDALLNMMWSNFANFLGIHVLIFVHMLPNYFYVCSSTF